MSDWTIKECPDCKALYENCSTCDGIGHIEEVNTTYDQNQPIGDTPSDYPAIGGEPIDARNGNDFFTVKKLQEDNKTDKEFKNVWQELDKIVEESYIKENLKSISDKELLEKRDYIYGTYRHRSYLNDIENEIRKRGLGNPDWHKDDKAELVEKLNKDGTGVKVARRGVNPNKTPHKVLQFMYVSKSDCDICKQYDGISFPLDSPNRPVIPRLESVSSRSKRPYTHPNCKCKWIIPISDIGYQNLIQARGGEAKSKEDYKSALDKIINSVKKQNPNFDKLDEREQNWLIMKQGIKMLKGESMELVDPIPIASMLKMTFDSIQPVILSRLHKDGNEVRDMIDSFVGEALSEQEKRDIIEEHNLDFTFENLIDIVSESLIKKIANEGGVGSGKKGHQKWMRGAYAGEECPNCMIRTEKKDGKCAICGI